MPYHLYQTHRGRDSQFTWIQPFSGLAEVGGLVSRRSRCRVNAGLNDSIPSIVRTRLPHTLRGQTAAYTLRGQTVHLLYFLLGATDFWCVQLKRRLVEQTSQKPFGQN